MGLPSIFGDIASKFKDISKQIGNGISTTTDKISNTVSNIVGTAHKDAAAVLSGVKDSTDKVFQTVGDLDKLLVNKAGDVLINGENTIGGIAKSFSWPLIIGAGIFGLFLLKK
jgi:phage-related protein